MNELTDLEIRKLISLFELHNQFPKAKSIEFDKSQNCFWVDNIGFTSWPLLDPLTDNALCFNLMIKYGIRYDGRKIKSKHHFWFGNIKNKTYIVNSHPNRAICLAIIKSKE